MPGKGDGSRDAALAAVARGARDRMALVRRALATAPNDGALIIAEARCGLEAGEPDPLARLTRVLAQAPDWIDGHKAFASLAYSLDHADPTESFARAVTTRPDDPRLWFAYIMTVANLGDPGRAADMAAKLRRTKADVPPLRLVEARYRGLAGEAEAAEHLLASCPSGLPDLELERLRNALRLEDVDRAGDIASESLENPDNTTSFFALAELAWRLSGERDRHAWLVGDNDFIATARILVPPELEPTLRAVHEESSAPLGQSIRGGTQTSGDLRTYDAEVIFDLFSDIGTVSARLVETMPGRSAPHPLSGLSADRLEIVSSWSVSLKPGGLHIPHLHENGLLSSAFHIAQEEDIPGEGVLELGVAPKDIPLEPDPLARFPARAGQLVLFPSFLYHRVTPISRGQRLAIAFDCN